MIINLSSGVYKETVVLMERKPNKIKNYFNKNFDFNIEDKDIKIIKDDDFEAITFNFSSVFLIVFDQDFKLWGDAKLISVAAHELSHVCFMLLGDRGFTIDQECKQEPYSYLLEYYMKMFLEKFKKQKKWI